MTDAVLTLIILGLAVVLFAVDRLPVAGVALIVPLALWGTGVLDLGEAVGGFGDPVVLFIASLFVVSEALDASGVTAWVGNFVIEHGGQGRARLLVVIMVTVAVLTALISPNGAVAAMTPVVVVIALRSGRSPSEMLLPTAFAAHAGSLLLLTGSPVTVLASDAIADQGGRQLGLLDIALIGGPLLVFTIAVVLFVPRLIPHRTAPGVLRDLGEHGALLGRHYGVGTEDLLSKAEGAAEFIVPPRSALVGDPVYRGMHNEAGDLVVVAIHHKGTDVQERHSLVAGDTLLLRGPWEALEAMAAKGELIAVDAPEAVRRQAVPLGRGARRTLAVLAGMVILLATGLVPPPVVGIVAALLLVVLGVLSVEQAYHGISWTTVILVGGMLSLSAAMQSSGAAGMLAEALVTLVGDAGPYALLAGMFVITAVLGQLISNTATALVMIPIGISAAEQLGVSYVPLVVAIAVFAAGALLTPIATPANLMVMEAAGYRFGDYWKLGLPLLLGYGAAGIFLVPLIWPL